MRARRREKRERERERKREQRVSGVGLYGVFDGLEMRYMWLLGDGLCDVM